MLTNTTISNVSPLLSYIPRQVWYEGNQSDPELFRYSNKSYHATGTRGASFSFTWFGTGIWVYGGYRTRLGPYQVLLDNESISQIGYRNGPEQFEALLFGRGGLSPGVHQIQVVNNSDDPGQSTLDLDYLVFENDLGNSTKIDNTSPQFSWFPATSDAWEARPTTQLTYDSMGMAQLNFTVSFKVRTLEVHHRHVLTTHLGNAVTLYGSVNSESSSFTISLDGWIQQTIHPNTQIDPEVNVSQVIYSRHDLLQGQHTLQICNNPSWSADSSATRLEVAHALVYSPAALPSGIPSHNMDHTGHIVGAIVGAFFFCLLCVTVLSICLQRRRQMKFAEEIAPRPFLLSPSSRGSTSLSQRHIPKLPALRRDSQSTMVELNVVPSYHYSMVASAPTSPSEADFPKLRALEVHEPKVQAKQGILLRSKLFRYRRSTQKIPPPLPPPRCQLLPPIPPARPPRTFDCRDHLSTPHL